ncbi:MAG: FHA domain-containing protein [Myxococcales bacterium]|nr:FHA domain-containing protein [Myxococcales bacterium]
MDLDVGYVCGRCDSYAPLDAVRCVTCGAALGFGPKARASSTQNAALKVEPPQAPAGAARGAPDSLPSLDAAFVDLDAPGAVAQGGAARAAQSSENSRVSQSGGAERLLDLPSLERALESVLPPPGETRDTRQATPGGFVGPVRLPVRFQLTEALMEQARSYSCKKCYSPVPAGHKFCGRCGEPVPREVLAAQTLLLSKMLEPGKAKLVLIKGEGFQTDPSDETVFLLGGPRHPCGRTQGDLVFDKDDWVSPLHATFYYRDDGRLVVRDEASLNGVFVRVKGPGPLQAGDCFLAGEQVFRLEAAPRVSDGPADDGTMFYSSPKRPSPFRVVQVLRGGIAATQVCARENAVTIGREGCDMNFPNDPYMSTRHCKVELTPDGTYRLVDTGSKNGTYLTIRQERELLHGDYIFVGRELLRVDISG